MKQQCPKCGKWVKGIEQRKAYISDMTKEDLKSGVGWVCKLGGAMDLIPGPGGLLGRAVTGTIAEIAKGTIDLVADNVKKKSFKYVCRCGHKWTDS